MLKAQIFVKVIFFATILLGFCTELHAQELVFINKKTGKTIKAKIGDQLALIYTGYRNQDEFYSQDIFDITDSSVFLGSDTRFAHPGLRKNFEKNGPSYKEILLKDFIRFRRISIGRKMLKQTIRLGTVIGTFFLISELIDKNNISRGQQFFISLGIGFGASYLINLALPENPKYEINDGWIVTTTK